MSWFNDFSFSLGIGAEVFILVAHKMTTSYKSRRILNPWETKNYHYNERQGGLKIENPLRSSSGDSKRNFLSNCPITIITF